MLARCRVLVPKLKVRSPLTDFRGAHAFSPGRLYRLCRSKAYLFRGVEIRWECDPSIITETRRYYVDIDTMQGMSYGSSIYWDETPLGHAGIPWPDTPQPKRQKPIPAVDARVANVPWNFDAARFTALFLKLMTEPMANAN